MVQEGERSQTRGSVPAGTATPVRRGWVSVYAAAFVLMLGAGLALAVSSLGSLRSFELLWFSVALSVGAIAAGLLSVLLPRHR
jgi:magnesium-transporting ATPase (P-type)